MRKERRQRPGFYVCDDSESDDEGLHFDFSECEERMSRIEKLVKLDGTRMFVADNLEIIPEEVIPSDFMCDIEDETVPYQEVFEDRDVRDELKKFYCMHPNKLL